MFAVVVFEVYRREVQSARDGQRYRGRCYGRRICPSAAIDTCAKCLRIQLDHSQYAWNSQQNQNQASAINDLKLRARNDCDDVLVSCECRMCYTSIDRVLIDSCTIRTREDMSESQRRLVG